MRPMASGEEAGWGNLTTDKQSLVPAVEELWNAWEIHFLMLVSFSLQVLLFLFAGLRRRSTSQLLRTVLWLAYLSADSVAIFVLGHLASHASQQDPAAAAAGHYQLLAFWAPFVLLHLGGQDTITAFSRQDNELWRRHLLNLVTQVAIAGYVVAEASWPPDGRIRAAMVLVFISGCFRYAERTVCLYFASPAKLRSTALDRLSQALLILREHQRRNPSSLDMVRARECMRGTFDLMLKGSSRSRPSTSSSLWIIPRSDVDIMSVEAPLNDVDATLVAAADLPDMLAKFLSSRYRYEAYKNVAARLAHCYQLLYTKKPLREYVYGVYAELDFPVTFKVLQFFLMSPLILYPLFRYALTPIALVLFAMAAEKGDLHASRADITVSYVLLVGAIVLDVISAILPIVSSNILVGGKLWSEELAQYSMIRRHVKVKPNNTCTKIVRELFDTDTKHTNISTPTKEFILDSLLHFGTRKEWSCSSSRGRLAIRDWMDRHEVPDFARPAKALVTSTDSGVDFPTSVLVWHLATDACYYLGGSCGSTSSSDETKKHKEVSREISNYITYLVFKRGVLLTSKSQLAHDEAHDEIIYWSPSGSSSSSSSSSSDDETKKHTEDDIPVTDEEGAFRRLFGDLKRVVSSDVPASQTMLFRRRQGTTVGMQRGKEPIRMGHLLHSTEEAIHSPVLPRARAVAHELLINIRGEAERWELIASVWAEMLYYTAPRCGGAFHYEHLNTGGELITHVLLLMLLLGPFLPSPDA